MGLIFCGIGLVQWRAEQPLQQTAAAIPISRDIKRLSAAAAAELGRSAAEVPLLREAFPNGRFSPPATEETIAAAETALGVRLPEQLRRLYAICDGFREDRGNAKYLLSLIEEDFIGSLVTITRCMWTEFATPDLRPFVFFGSSSGGETWGINIQRPSEIIAYHHHMEDEYEIAGTDIVEVYRAEYARYDELV